MPVSDGGGSGTAGGENPIDKVFDVFMAAERRHAIRLLQEADEPIAIADLAHEIAGQDLDPPETVAPFADVLRARNYLKHVHVPKLADENVVEYDEEGNTIVPGADFDTFANVLRLIDDLLPRE